MPELLSGKVAVKTRQKSERERMFKRFLSNCKGKQGALIPLLQKTQEIFGYLPEKALTKIARGLALSPSQVYGVATFYSQFHLNPIGTHLIRVCHGTACHVAGAEKISEMLERILGITTGETTADGKFTLENVACLGCCSLSPVIIIDKTVHGKLVTAKLPEIIKKYR
jgi:NADH-quinone oxidoreductase subunit E